MDILHSLKYGAGQNAMVEQSTDSLRQVNPQTVTEMLDSQIKFYESKIADLKEAKAAISPEVERALNALAKL